MSWSFEYHGKCKDSLKKACCNYFYLQNRVKYYQELDAETVRVIAVINTAIDTAKLPYGADCFKVKSSGHVSHDQCYFSVEVVPVYFPKLVDQQ